MNYSELMQAHRYAEVVAVCEEGLKARPDDGVLLAQHAHAMLGLGRLPEALEEFRRLNERERASPFPSTFEILYLGGILWMLGRTQEAIETFQATIDGILDRSITHADFAGGVTPGILLWYAATTAGDAESKERSLTYLRNRARRKAITSWPGPLAMYVLGTASKEDVLKQACGTPELKAAMRIARADLLKRRYLIEATFCFATRSREQGAEDDCIRWMHRCAGLRNPTIEWYLAHAEAERSGPPRPDPEEAGLPEGTKPGRGGLIGWLRSLKP
jgi:tetratricopeptide (TPR) repeat protein